MKMNAEKNKKLNAVHSNERQNRIQLSLKFDLLIAKFRTSLIVLEFGCGWTITLTR